MLVRGSRGGDYENAQHLGAHAHAARRPAVRDRALRHCRRRVRGGRPRRAGRVDRLVDAGPRLFKNSQASIF